MKKLAMLMVSLFVFSACEVWPLVSPEANENGDEVYTADLPDTEGQVAYPAEETVTERPASGTTEHSHDGDVDDYDGDCDCECDHDCDCDEDDDGDGNGQGGDDCADHGHGRGHHDHGNGQGNGHDHHCGD